MSFRYYNAHPRKLSVDDCVKRSIALATGIPYIEVQKGLNDHKKITGVKKFYNYPNPESYMKKVLGFERIAVAKNADGTRVTVEEFAKLHPCGRYVISISEHWTACIDGIIYDTWDCSKAGVLSYYEITSFKKTTVEKKYCFTVKRECGNCVFVTVYDGNGNFATKKLLREAAREYIDSLYARGFFNYDEMGEYI
jgi:hypothetical protein